MGEWEIFVCRSALLIDEGLTVVCNHERISYLGTPPYPCRTLCRNICPKHMTNRYNISGIQMCLMHVLME